VISDEDLSRLQNGKARKAEEIFANSTILGQLREAASRRQCDWGWQLDTMTGPDLYAFLLPEIQQTRTLSRFLVLRARLAILDGRYDDALEALRINLKLGRDTGSEPILVCGLVGVAEAAMGNRAVIDFVAAPKSPNLYWALTELPNPVVDFRTAVRFEMGSNSRVFPFLKNAATEEHSPEEWGRLLANGFNSMMTLSSSNFGVNNGTVAQMAVAGMSLIQYTPAKERLVAAGMDRARIEAMPVGQVIAIDWAQEFRKQSDELEKWWYQPFRVARERADEVGKHLGENRLQGGFGHIRAALLRPALQAAREAEVRLQWQIGGLRTVEAIRMHAAETGKLPASLDEVKVVPAPENPATGRAYEYRLDGDTGVVELPLSDGFRNVSWRFEIKLAK
jgi:hypothetical protein